MGCVVDETRLRDDLGADWLDRLELLIVIENALPGLKFKQVVAEQIETVGDLMRAIKDSAIHPRLRARENALIHSEGQHRG